MPTETDEDLTQTEARSARFKTFADRNLALSNEHRLRRLERITTGHAWALGLTIAGCIGLTWVAGHGRN